MAMIIERRIEMENLNGINIGAMQGAYKPQTTFYSDFSIADAFGVNAVKDTFKRAFEEWKSNTVYLTELVMVLNHKCWEHYDKGNDTLSKLYSDLYYKANDYAWENLKGDDLTYFFNCTD